MCGLSIGVEALIAGRAQAAFEAYKESELPQLKVVVCVPLLSEASDSLHGLSSILACECSNTTWGSTVRHGRRLITLSIQDLLYKQFQKSPDNPCVGMSYGGARKLNSRRFNQVTVAYDATKGQRVEALQEKQQQVQDRLRT